MARVRPRFRRRNQQALDLLQRVQRAADRVDEAEQQAQSTIIEDAVEQLSDETHIPEDNRFTGTLRIDDDGMAYLNDRPLGVITEVTQEANIGDTITTGTISAEHIRVGQTPDELSEHLEALRTFPYRPYEPADLTSLQVGGVHSQPNTSLGVNSTLDAWVNAPLRGITAEHIHMPEPAVPSWQDDIEREYRELYAAREAERASEFARGRELERQLAELGQTAPTIQVEPMQVQNLSNEILQEEVTGTTQDLATTEAVHNDGIARPRTLTFTRDEDDARRIAQTIGASIEGMPRYANYSTGTIRRSKTYTFDEEKVTTLMDTIRVVQAIMSKYTFSEEDIKKLGIEDLTRER